MIANVKDLEKVKKDEVGLVKRVGKRAKKEIVESAVEKGITLLNGDQSFLKKLETEMSKRKSRQKPKLRHHQQCLSSLSILFPILLLLNF